MSSNIRIFIKINYICSIFYFIRKIISRINPIKSRFILNLGSFTPALITPLPANIFRNRLGPNVPNSKLRNPAFCFFTSFLVVPLTLLIIIQKLQEI